MKNTFTTGGEGFNGSHVVSLFVNENPECPSSISPSRFIKVTWLI